MATTKISQTQLDFVRSTAQAADAVERSTSIPAVFIQAQAALESAWGRAAPGHSYFGVKDRDGVTGNEQLLLTTEYSRRPNLRFPQVVSVTPVTINGVRMYRYRVRDWFRRYASIEECFADHARLLRSPRYAGALFQLPDIHAYARAVAAAGYATDPAYATKLSTLIRTVQRLRALTGA